jgi:hypothetical protein
VATQQLDEQAGRSHTLVDVRVVSAAGGGWDVIATRGDRVVAIQHCDDWHRAERAHLRMRADTRLLDRIEAA